MGLRNYDFIIGFPAVTENRFYGDSASREAINREKYLVERVAMCVECHTPRNEKGEMLADQYLKGAPIPVDPPPLHRMDTWIIVLELIVVIAVMISLGPVLQAWLNAWGYS
jgi:hypothetical protein